MRGRCEAPDPVLVRQPLVVSFSSQIKSRRAQVEVLPTVKTVDLVSLSGSCFSPVDDGCVGHVAWSDPGSATLTCLFVYALTSSLHLRGQTCSSCL